MKKHWLVAACGLAASLALAERGLAQATSTADASMHVMGHFGYILNPGAGSYLSSFHVTGSLGAGVGAAMVGNNCPCDSCGCTTPGCNPFCADDPDSNSFDITSGSSADSVGASVSCVGGAGSCGLGFAYGSGSWNCSSTSGGLHWEGGALHHEDWAQSCGGSPLECAYDTSVRLCKTMVGDWTFTSLDGSSGTTEGEIDLQITQEIDSAAGGWHADATCTPPGTITAPVTHAGKVGRISSAVTIERLNPSTGSVLYSRSVTIVTLESHSATSHGSCSQSSQTTIDPSNPQTDTYVVVDLGDVETNLYGCNTYCSNVYMPGGTDGYISHLKIQVGKAGSSSERWRVTLHKTGTIYDLPEDPIGNVAGAGSTRGCISGADCDLPGDQPDTVADVNDLRAIYAAAGTHLGDCAYLEAIDLDHDGYIDPTTEAMGSRCWEMLDADESGFVDYNDPYAFADLMTASDCRADINGDGFLDFFDYDEYMTMFEGGLPACSQGASVPPPVCAS